MATRQTYEEFLRTVRPEQLGADGRFLGPQSGTAYYAEGLTPQDFYNAHFNDQRDTGRFTGSGDNMQAEMESAGPVSADWTEGPTGNRGLFGGVSDMLTNKKTLMGLLAMGGIGALSGAFSGAGAAAGAGEAAGFSGIGGTGGAAGLGSGTALGGAELAGAAGAGDIAALTGNQIAALSPAATGSGFSFAVPEAMNSAVGLDLGGIATTAAPEAAFAGIGGTGGAAGVGSGTALGGAGTAGGASGGGLLGRAANYLSNPSNLLQLGGTALGALGGAAASRDSTTGNSSSRDPWGPAQPYLRDQLATNAAMAEHYRANPFSELQQQQYQGLFNTLANNQANAPGLLANASSFGQSSRGRMPAMQGLLSGTQAAPINWSAYQNIGRRG